MTHNDTNETLHLAAKSKRIYIYFKSITKLFLKLRNQKQVYGSRSTKLAHTFFFSCTSSSELNPEGFLSLPLPQFEDK